MRARFGDENSVKIQDIQEVVRLASSEAMSLQGTEAISQSCRKYAHTLCDLVVDVCHLLLEGGCPQICFPRLPCNAVSALITAADNNSAGVVPDPMI